MSIVLTAILSRLKGAALTLATLGTLAALALFAFARARKAATRAEHLATRLRQLETANETQRQMLQAAARRPQSRADLTDRLRNGKF